MPMNTTPPWGKKKKPAGPEELLAELIQKIRDFFDGQSAQGASGGQQQEDGGKPDSSRNFLSAASKIAAVVVAVLLLRGVFACFYTIEAGEKGIVLRFGRYSRTAEPGLNFKMPFLEDMERVNVETVRKEEFGFRTRMPGESAVFDKKSSDDESLMLTGDKNVIDVAWIVQYKISDPVNYLFKVSDVPQAVRDNSETVIRRIVGNLDFDYVLGNRIMLADMARQELQRDLNKLETGISIVTLQMLDITPTDEVKPAFNEVNEADQDMKRLVNEAEEQYNRVIPKARGSAKQLIEEAHGYAVQRLNDAKGETARFTAIAAEYGKAKEVTRQRMYLETMQSILPQVKQVYIMDKPVLPFLNLNGAERTALPPSAPLTLPQENQSK
jgi:membrane protease subunit HflK